jgi:hypothetical protein
MGGNPSITCSAAQERISKISSLKVKELIALLDAHLKERAEAIGNHDRGDNRKIEWLRITVRRNS